ncbi:WecB/TagA/CpsF family glycosyltransferase [Shewanella sp. 125m-7]
MAKKYINCNLENKFKSADDIYSILEHQGGSGKIVSFVNPFSYTFISSNNRLVQKVDYWFSDGALLCFFSNIFRRDNKITRASFDFSSLAGIVFDFCERNTLNVAVVGGACLEIESAIINLKVIHPRLNVVYKRDGYFSTDEFAQVSHEINSSEVDVLIVGMGTPLQEEFSVFCNEKVKNIRLTFTCGGFISQTAIKGDYYHPLIKKFGLRWLQRAYMHSHVRQRLFKDYPVFIFRYLLNR